MPKVKKDPTPGGVVEIDAVAQESQQLFIPSHTKLETSDERFFRFVDLEGDWKYYWDDEDKKFRPSITYILNVAYPKGEGFHQYLLRTTKEEAEKKLKFTGERGSRIHDAITDLIKGVKITRETKYQDETGQWASLTMDEWKMLQGWMNWVADYKPEVIAFEITVRSRTYDFIGTLDFFGTIEVPQGDKSFPKSKWGKRILILIDWKTSSGIWNSYKAQTGGYVDAIKDMKLFPEHRKFFGAVHSGIVRVGTKHKAKYEFKVWDHHTTMGHLSLLKGARSLFDEEIGPFKGDDIIEQIPAHFEVKIEKSEPRDKGKLPFPEKKEEEVVSTSKTSKNDGKDHTKGSKGKSKSPRKNK